MIDDESKSIKLEGMAPYRCLLLTQLVHRATEKNNMYYRVVLNIFIKKVMPFCYNMSLPVEKWETGNLMTF